MENNIEVLNKQEIWHKKRKCKGHSKRPSTQNGQRRCIGRIVEQTPHTSILTRQRSAKNNMCAYMLLLVLKNKTKTLFTVLINPILHAIALLGSYSEVFCWCRDVALISVWTPSQGHGITSASHTWSRGAMTKRRRSLMVNGTERVTEVIPISRVSRTWASHLVSSRGMVHKGLHRLEIISNLVVETPRIVNGMAGNPPSRHYRVACVKTTYPITTRTPSREGRTVLIVNMD